MDALFSILNYHMTTITQHQLQAICPSLDASVVMDFYGRMDPEYFENFPLKTVGLHLELLNTLSPTTPCAIHMHKKKIRTYDLTLVAYDYFSEFSTVCGLLSACGLDIREASIFTYLDTPSPNKPSTRHPASAGRNPSWPNTYPSRRPGLTRKKVVDVFQVHVLPEFTFDRVKQQYLLKELTNLLLSLEAKQTRDVRSQVNRLLIEALGKRKQPSSDLIHPVEINFNNKVDPDNTIIDIHATDSPAFLYAFSNALTMRGIYISKAKIEVDGPRVHDRFYVRGRHGQKIQGTQEKEELRLAAALIKEFTHSLLWAPDPGKALHHFDLFLDQLLEEQPSKVQVSWLNKKENLTLLAQLLGASDFLWEDFLRRQHKNVMPILKDFQKDSHHPTKPRLASKLKTQLARIKVPDGKKKILNQFKDQELFRIDMDHLLRGSSLPEFSVALTTLAEIILEQALIQARSVVNQTDPYAGKAEWQSIPFTICGLGKLGGEELGYASDIEILFIFENSATTTMLPQPEISEYFERLAQEFLRWIEAKQEGIFHIDVRLRPHGEKGHLANSIEEIQQYYNPKGQAAKFERQALIKLRHVAGDVALGKRVERHRDSFVYSKESWPLETALHLRERQTQELVASGTIHVKYSPGGLIDIEYTVQYLQLINGKDHPSLHTTNTIEAIYSLQRLGLITMEEGKILEEDYLFMRRLIDALRIVRGNAQDLVLPPSSSEDMIFLARRMGSTTENWQEGARLLEKDIHKRMRRTRTIFVEHFFPPATKKQTSPKNQRPPRREKGP